MLKKQKGYSLIEIMISLGIIMIILSFIFILYNTISEKIKINDELKKINTTMSLAQTYPDKNTGLIIYEGNYLENKALLEAGFIQDEGQNSIRGNFGYVGLNINKLPTGNTSGFSNSIIFQGTYPSHVIYNIESAYRNRDFVVTNTCSKINPNDSADEIRAQLKKDSMNKIDEQLKETQKQSNMSDEQIKTIRDQMEASVESMFNGISDEDIKENAKLSARADCNIMIVKY